MLYILCSVSNLKRPYTVDTSPGMRSGHISLMLISPLGPQIGKRLALMRRL